MLSARRRGIRFIDYQDRKIAGFKQTPSVREMCFRGRAVVFDTLVALCYLLCMSQPVKLSDALVLDARLAGETVERSIAGQVEFWARMGRAIEPLLKGDQVLALCRNGAARTLSECLGSVDSPAGRQRLSNFLQSQPFPHYKPHPKKRGLLVRIDANGKQTVGRFVNRQFRAVKSGK